jgi:hypothetical protein
MSDAKKEEVVVDGLLAKLGKARKDDVFPLKNITILSRFQTRAGYGANMVDDERVKDFSTKMDAGEEFPEVKIMEVEDAPGAKGEKTYILFDGFHTRAAREMSKHKTIAARIWTGTWAMAHAAAATANVEHDDGGKPRTNADKKKAVESLANAYMLAFSDDKKSWPSNRGLAAEVGWVSYQFVNEVDPFGRKSNGDNHDKTKAKKREAAKKPEVAAPPAPPPHAPASALTWELRDTKTNKLLGKVEGTSRQKAMEAAKAKLPPDVKLDNVIIALPPLTPGKSGEPAPTKIFDFDMMDRNLGSIVRGLDALGESFDLRKTPEFAGAERSLNSVVEQFVKWRKELTAKKKPEPKKEETKATEPVVDK